MNKFKKRIAAVLVFLIAVGAFSGCDKKSTSGDKTEKLHISFMNIGTKGNYDNAYVKKLYDETFNISLDAQFLSNDEYLNKRTLLFASGDIPDVIYHLDPEYLQADVKQGFIAELPYETIKKYAPKYAEYITEQEETAWLYPYYDGKNYGIPNTYLVGNDPKLGLWRLDWLKCAGIDKVPETLKEMSDAFYKIANADIDGDGKKNTYCISVDMTRYGNVFGEIFGAYGLLPFNWVLENGKVVYGGLNKNIKEPLKLLQDWYKEGIIHPDFITDTAKTIESKFENGQLAYVFAGGNEIYSEKETSVVNITKSLQPNAKFDVSAPPEGENGKRGHYNYGLAGHIIAFSRQTEKTPEKVQKFLEIIEYLNENEDFRMKALIGEEGKHYEFNDKSKGFAGGVTMLPPYDDANVLGEEGFSDFQRMYSMWGFQFLPPRIETWNKYRPEYQRRAINKVIDPNKEYILKDVFLKADVVPKSSDYLDKIRTAQAEYIMKIISGKYDVDRYDEFIEKFNSLGGKELTGEAEKLYGIKEEIIKKMK